MVGFSPVIYEVDDGAKDLKGALGIRLDEIAKIKAAEPDGGEHALDLAVQIEGPDGIHMVVGVIQKLESTESDLYIRFYAAKRGGNKRSGVRVRVKGQGADRRGVYLTGSAKARKLE